MFKKATAKIQVHPYMTYGGDKPKDITVDGWRYQDFFIHRPVSYETGEPRKDCWHVSHLPTGMSLNSLFIQKDYWRIPLGELKERVQRAARFTAWEHLRGKPWGWQAGPDMRETLAPIINNRLWILTNQGEIQA